MWQVSVLELPAKVAHFEGGTRCASYAATTDTLSFHPTSRL